MVEWPAFKSTAFLKSGALFKTQGFCWPIYLERILRAVIFDSTHPGYFFR